MKIFVVLLLTIFLTPICFADVDLIIQTKHHWKEGLNFGTVEDASKIDTTGWTNRKWKLFFVDYWRQTFRGDIISVLPVKPKHGNMCCEPPEGFITITVTGVSVEQVKNYMGYLIDTLAFPLLHGDTISIDTMMVKERRYFLPEPVVQLGIDLYELDGGRLVFTKAEAKAIIREYNFNTIKTKIRNKLRKQ